MKTLLCIAVLALSGCASMTPEREWFHGSWPSASVEWVQVQGREVYAKCGNPARSGVTTMACAVQDRESGVCTIYSLYSEDHARHVYTSHGDDLRSHERRHCAGWRHG